MSNSIKITQAVSWLMDVDPVATGKRLCKQRKALNLSQKKLSALFDEGESACGNANFATFNRENAFFFSKLYVSKDKI